MNLYKLLLLGIMVVFTVMGNAQSQLSEVLSTAGGTSQVGKIRLAWTVGETAVSRWSTPNGGSVTEGFHQPKLVFTEIGASSVALVRIAPNPVQTNLQLVVDNKETRDLSATLIDLQGRILWRLNHLIVGNNQINLDQYPSGVYFLSIQDVNEVPLQTFKVVKTQ